MPYMKCHVVCHAVYNTVINKGAVDVKGCTVYTTHFPCNECAKLIVQAGIKRVVYAQCSTVAEEKTDVAKILFQKAGIGLR